jgi:hypothetical protein
MKRNLYTRFRVVNTSSKNNKRAMMTLKSPGCKNSP